MANVRAGDIRQLTFFGRELSIKGEDANVTIDLGGYSNEAGINGNGSLHVTQRRKKARIADVPVSIDDLNEDLEYLQSKANFGEIGPLTIVLASAVTYSGSMVLVGDLAKSTGDGISTISFEGAKLEQI